MDTYDRRLLAAVQRDNLSSLAALGRHVNLSAPAVARRLQRLRATGVITKDVAVVDPVLVGRPLTLIVEVSIDSERLELVREIRERFRHCPQIQKCYYVTGDCDFILIVTARDMEEYEALTRTLFFSEKNIRHFKTFVSMQRIKDDTLLPMD